MKNIVLSAVAVLAMSSFAVAGGDIAPVEEPVVVPEPVVTDSGFYIGGAYSYLNDTADITDNSGNFPTNTSGIIGGEHNLFDTDHSDIMLQAGYKFNSYVAIEGRYWFGLSDETIYNDVDTSVDAWGIYVKSMYPVTDAFDIYALLGYGATDYTFSQTITGNNGWITDRSLVTDSDDGFSWGLGASYAFTDNVAIFIDYVSIYSDSEDYVGLDASGLAQDFETDRTVDTWNFGVTYQF